MAIITLSKKDVAESQLFTAIRLLFQGGDPASIHSLAVATHEILDALTRKDRTIKTFMAWVTESVPGEHRDKLISLLREPQNFFKHGSRDPQDKIEFDTEHTELLLYDSSRMYMVLSNLNTAEIHTYNLWFVMRHREMFANNELHAPLHAMAEEAKASGLNPDDLPAFDNLLCDLIDTGLFPIHFPPDEKF